MPKRLAAATLEQLKQSVDLVALIEGSGVALKKRGRSYQGCCPFHEDKTPSFTVTPAKQLWHCFGCGEGGDAIRFIEKREGVSFKEAVKRLGLRPASGLRPAQSPSGTPAPSSAPAQPVALSEVERAKLLERVARFYAQRFLDRAEGLQYLVKRRGIKNVPLLRDYRIGYADGALLSALPQDDERSARFRALGVITERGREFFCGCVVFPLFDANGNVVNLYGRRIEDGEVKHLYLPGSKVGVWNYQAARRSRSLLLTESVIDALTLVDRGLPDVLPCYGAGGLSEDQLALLDQCKTQSITLCFDGDEAGRRGAEKVTEQLKGKPIAVHGVTLPEGEDINSFLSKHELADFKALLPRTASSTGTASSNSVALGTGVAPAAGAPVYERTAHGFTWRAGVRCYEVKAIARQGTQLKATLKASLTTDKGRGFELHTLDLYSARSREAYAHSCAALFGLEAGVVKADLTQILEQVEAWTPADSAAPVKVEMSEHERDAALALLRDPQLLDRIEADLSALGVAGESLNKQLCYLASISRKLDDPLSLLIQSRSAAGKSTLQHAVLSLVPEEDKVVYTRMTDQALFYQDPTALVHKVLALEEAAGLGGAAYSLRALQSSKQLAIATTSKDPATGKLRTEHYTVQGPVAVLLTTTSASLDEETLSRFLTVTIDESAEMTARIFAEQREADTLAGYLRQRERAALIARHQAAQRLLEPIAVINPYAPQLTFPTQGLRARRDHKKYLMLIKVIAFLHQHQRVLRCFRTPDEGRTAHPEDESTAGVQPLRYIEVTKDDIRHANRLALSVLGASSSELSAPARNLLAHVHRFVKQHCEAQRLSPREYTFTRKDVREAIGWSDWQVRTHIRELEDLEYLKARSGAWGKEYVYELLYEEEVTDVQRWALTLIDPDTLKDPTPAEPL